MQSLGIAPRQIDEMIWRDVEDLFGYWREHPPVHLLVAGYMGYKPPVQSQIQSGPESLAELKALLER